MFFSRRKNQVEKLCSWAYYAHRIQISWKQTMEDFTVTTIYYDGQFWCALIEKNTNGIYYSGRYVFGAEPTNPRLLYWMLYEFDKIPVVKTSVPVKIRIKKITERTEKSLTKSLDAFKNAQSEFLSEKKAERRIERREDKQEKWEAKREKRKEQKRH